MAAILLLSGFIASEPWTERLVAPASSVQPHVLLALVDDYGWANAGWHRNYTAPGGAFVNATAEVTTTHMDRLVREGIELDRAYAFKFCSPSRSALQTGRDPYHVNVVNAEPSIANRSDPEAGFAGIPLSMTGLATKLAAAGYVTAMFGKWDAGGATADQTPRGRGYQQALSYFHHLNDEWSYTVWQQACSQGNATVPIVDLWVAPRGQAEGPAHGWNNSCTGDQPTGGAPAGCKPGPKGDAVWGGYEDALLAQQAVAAVEAHDATQPLFLFWAPHAVHTPLQVPQQYVDRFAFVAASDKPAHERQLYSATVAFVDDAFANITNAFERKGMFSKLLIVMSADNGGPVYFGGFGGANNHPLKGGKLTNWEGGIRVNSFVSGGFLPATVRGTRHSGLVALWDWYATLCSLAGVDATDVRAAAAGLPPIDSVDHSGLLLGINLTSARTELALGTDPTATDLENAPSCGTFAAVHRQRDDPTILGGAPTSLPRGGACATLNGLIQMENATLWKLLLGHNDQSIVTGPFFPNASTPAALPAAVVHCGHGCLFDLTADPLEATDLAAAMPQRVERMRNRLEALLPTAFNPHRGGVDPRAC